MPVSSCYSRRGFLAAASAVLAAQVLPAATGAKPVVGSVPIQRRIPRDARPIAAVGLGTWQAFDVAAESAEAEGALATLRLFAAHGLGVIDTSPMYGRAEATLGELLAQADPQQQCFVASKVWTQGRQAGIAQIERSFDLLRRQQLALLQVHNLLDYPTQLATLREYRQAGRIRYLGASHYTSAAHAGLIRAMESDQLDFIQVNYSLAERDAAQRVLPAAAANGVAVLINRPFAEGEVFRRSKGKPLPDWAAQIGCASWGQFALKFILGQAAVTCVIPGTRNPRHLLDNLAGASGALPDQVLVRRMAAYYDAL